MKETTVTLTGVIDTFLVLLIGIGPKIALVPFLQITAPLPADVRGRVRRKMLMTAATAALVLVLLARCCASCSTSRSARCRLRAA